MHQKKKQMRQMKSYIHTYTHTFFFFTLTFSSPCFRFFFGLSSLSFLTFFTITLEVVGSLGFFSFATRSCSAASEGVVEVGRPDDIAVEEIVVGSSLSGLVVGGGAVARGAGAGWVGAGGATSCADGSDGGAEASDAGAEATTATVGGVGAADGGASAGCGLFVFIADEMSQSISLIYLQRS